MADHKTRIVLDDFSGGRNGADPPLGPTFAATQVVDAVNVDWYRTAGARKRHGSSNVGVTGSGWVGIVSWLGRHVPGTAEADAELWGVDDANPTTFQRLDNSTTWTTPVVVQDGASVASSPWDITCCSLNGLFFIAFASAVPRLHCYEASTDSLRRTGITPGTNAPTVADTGAGTYAATLRYYRVRWFRTSGSISEPTPSVSFTPSGIGTHARITKPTTPTQESIIGWIVEASADNVTFYAIATVALVATTTWDDNVVVAAYATTGTLSQLTGSQSLQKAYRFIAADQNRLIGFGSYTSTDVQNRIEISAVLGSSDRGDAERVDTTSTYYYDLDEKDSGVPTGLIGPVFGNFYPLKSRQLWELTPTGQITDPFRRTAISKELGCVSSHGACVGEDPGGNPCLYTMTHRGVYRYGQSGLIYVGRGIEDLIIGPTSTMNMAATKVICHMVYHPVRRQLWVWFATGSSNDADALCVLNVLTGGWARFTGGVTAARCSVMFAASIGATMGFATVPYIGGTVANNRVIKCDDTAVSQDSSVSYQATITTRPLEPAGPGMKGFTGDAIVLAPVATGVTLTATITPDFGAGTAKSGTALLTAAGSETRVSKRLEGSAIGAAQFVQITLGDSAAANNAWSFDRVTVPVGGQEPIS
jgi:hypothetical protein